MEKTIVKTRKGVIQIEIKNQLFKDLSFKKIDLMILLLESIKDIKQGKIERIL